MGSPGPSPSVLRSLYLIGGILLVAVVAVVAISKAMPKASAGKPAAASPNTWCTDKSSMDILGDSASTGTGLTDPGNSWIAKLRAVMPHTRINTYAHDGAMVSDFLPGGRWPETLGAVSRIAVDKPSLVLIELGGNESYHDLDPARYQANLEQLTKAIWAVSPRSTLVYETIWQFDPREPVIPAHTWDDYANAMRTVVDNHAAGSIDLRQDFPRRYADDVHTHLLNTDKIHPTDAGNAVEFAVISSMLTRC
jgi:acyl-CoA thioesterase-1